MIFCFKVGTLYHILKASMEKKLLGQFFSQLIEKMINLKSFFKIITVALKKI